ncbi:DUF302 domain-containing protein [Thalassococcus sp. S3]|uniref:DUF302 domain-containing protein n=1 Tax=Thalassococcus sp. S3 TaxID=2017482 RepID=UPI0010247CE5|nr:DUF302 domain-containing protein [Thalassococcus sp. S3]QBF32493.1 camphor resistance protein CrcB [Thalassococcus sp. S3]
MKSLFVAGMVTLASTFTAAAGELTKIETSKSVGEAIDALEAAVGNAGGTVFARVDHGAGAASVEMELSDAQLLIFGNPKLGTPAMQADPLAGLYLPLKVLAYEDGTGQVWLVYEDPADMLSALEIPGDAEVISRMQGALGNLTEAAAN